MAADPLHQTTLDDDDWLAEWQHGYTAARKYGLSYEACPHLDGADRINWQEGWMIGKMERDMEDEDCGDE